MPVNSPSAVYVSQVSQDLLLCSALKTFASQLYFVQLERVDVGIVALCAVNVTIRLILRLAGHWRSVQGLGEVSWSNAFVSHLTGSVPVFTAVGDHVHSSVVPASVGHTLHTCARGPARWLVPPAWSTCVDAAVFVGGAFSIALAISLHVIEALPVAVALVTSRAVLARRDEIVVVETLDAADYGQQENQTAGAERRRD